MPPIRPERGVTLIELVVVIVVLGIVVAAVAFFLNPIRQSTDLALRADLTDIADNTLQRIGRDVKLALPNSVRVTVAGGSVFLEFLSLRDAGRYRAGSGSVAGGVACEQEDASISVAENDQLSFDLAPPPVSPGDRCFKTIGKLASAASVTTSDYLVLSNYGTGFPGQNAYEASAANRARIDALVDTSEPSRDRIHFLRTNFSRPLHDSPGKRFFIIAGPVSYVCNPAAGTITRYWNYGTPPFNEPLAAQPTSFASGNSALIAEFVQSGTGCDFDYSTVGPQLGLLTMRISLRRQLFGGTTETISLYHAVHVNNAP
jgi:MSHA biogenesis protein MshO